MKKASVTKENGKTIVRINSSAMSLLQTCQRKAQYNLFNQVESAPSVAQSFGTLIHKALEQYYMLTPELHTPEIITEIWAKVALDYQDPEDSSKPHTKAIGHKLLKSYADTFKNDPWVAVRDKDGKALTESQFEFPIFSFADEIEYRLFGTIDMIVKNTETGEYAVMDHKTGRTLGQEFVNRWNPNNQVSAYILALNKFYNFRSNKAVINGLQVAKTVHATCRVEARRDFDQLDEFVELARSYCRDLVDLSEGKQGRAADGITCSQFGGCAYQNVCALTPKLRDTALQNMKETQQVEE